MLGTQGRYGTPLYPVKNHFINIAADPLYTNISEILGFFPANTKHLYTIYTMLDQRRRRWADVV